MEKTCPKCELVKPADAFHRSRSNKDGLDRTCKLCARLRKAAQYERDGEKMLARNQAWKDRARGHISEYNRSHFERNRIKYKARQAVNAAVKRGQLTRPAVCNRCRETALLYGHHHSYAPEHWLDVEWLCKRCHLRHHAQEKSA
jgi:hypothetical protein